MKEKICHLFTHVCFFHCYLLAFDAAVSSTSNLWEGPQRVCSGFLCCEYFSCFGIKNTTFLFPSLFPRFLVICCFIVGSIFKLKSLEYVRELSEEPMDGMYVDLM